MNSPRNAKSTRIGCWITAAAFLTLASSAFAMDSPGRQSDVEAIKALFVRFNDVANDRDPHAMASLFADDADFITVNGGIDHGPAAIEKHMRQLFSGPGRSLHRDATLRAIRFLKPDTAVLYSDTETSGAPGAASAVPQPGFYEWVVMKKHGRWQIVIWHESNVARPAAARPVPH